ncbi:MAG: DM13 domain-containing protein [Gammaproteobacteria bacterium]
MNSLTHFSRLAGVFLVLLIGAASFSSAAHAADEGSTWTKRYQKIHGTWKIVETDEGRFLELNEKFKTRRAPDLKLFLSPRLDADVTPDNAVAGSVLIAKLKKAKGAQRYALPADLDLNDFETLVLHCEQYTKLWGVSPLR